MVELCLYIASAKVILSFYRLGANIVDLLGGHGHQLSCVAKYAYYLFCINAVQITSLRLLLLLSVLRAGVYLGLGGPKRGIAGSQVFDDGWIIVANYRLLPPLLFAVKYTVPFCGLDMGE